MTLRRSGALLLGGLLAVVATCVAADPSPAMSATGPERGPPPVTDAGAAAPGDGSVPGDVRMERSLAAPPDAGVVDDRGVPASPFGAPLPPQRVVDRRPYLLLGSGVRRKPPDALYGIALYVDEIGARRAFPALASRAGGRGRDKLLGGDKSPPFVVWGDFGKLAVVRLLRDAPLAEVRGIFEEGLESQLSERASPELRERAQALIAAFDRDLKRGEAFELRTTPGGLIEVHFGEVHRQIATDARLARALWETWLGGRPVQLDLRRALIDRVDLLGR